MTKENVIYGFICLFFWSLIVVIDLSLVGIDLPYLVGDAETGWYSVGINWLTLDPLLWRHHPTPTMNVLSGIMVFFLDIDSTEKPIKEFIRIGIGLQGLLVFFCGIWFSWAANLLDQDRLNKCILLVVIFCFPPLVLGLGHWAYRPLIALIGLPLGLTLLAAFNRNKRALAIGGAGCGFLAANFYPSSVTSVLFICLMVWKGICSFGLPSVRVSLTSFLAVEKYIMVLVAVCFIAVGLGMVSTQPINESLISQISVRILVVTSGWMLVLYMTLVLIRWDRSFQHFFFWWLMAFVAANNVLLPWYFHGLEIAKGRTIQTTEAFYRLINAPVDYPWLLVAWFSILSVLMLLALRLLRKRKGLKQSEGILYGAVFAFVGTAIIAMVGAAELRVGLLPGKAERIFVAAIPVLAVSWVVIFRSLRGMWLRSWQIILISLSLFSLVHFYQAYLTRIEVNRVEGLALDGEIENFFKEYPNGRLVCVGEEFNSRYCATAYAYNRYRTKTSTEAFPTRRLFDGRVISLNIRPDQFGDWIDPTDLIEELIFDQPGPLFVVTLLGNFRLQLLSLFHEHRYDAMPIWRWQAEGRKNIDDVVLRTRYYGSFLAGLKSFSMKRKERVVIGENKIISNALDRSGQDLRNENLVRMNLVGANLRQAILIGVDLQGVQLNNANLIEAKLSEADFTNADLSRANLHLADLAESNLSNARLVGATFWGADLRGADLTGADLSYANLWGAILERG